MNIHEVASEYGERAKTTFIANAKIPVPLDLYCHQCGANEGEPCRRFIASRYHRQREARAGRAIVEMRNDARRVASLVEYMVFGGASVAWTAERASEYIVTRSIRPFLLSQGWKRDEYWYGQGVEMWCKGDRAEGLLPALHAALADLLGEIKLQFVLVEEPAE